MIACEPRSSVIFAPARSAIERMISVPAPTSSVATNCPGWQCFPADRSGSVGECQARDCDAGTFVKGSYARCTEDFPMRSLLMVLVFVGLAAPAVVIASE